MARLPYERVRPQQRARSPRKGHIEVGAGQPANAEPNSPKYTLLFGHRVVSSRDENGISFLGWGARQSCGVAERVRYRGGGQSHAS